MKSTRILNVSRPRLSAGISHYVPIPPFPFHNGKYPLYIPNVPLTHIYCTGTDTVILYNMSMCTGVDLCEPIYVSENSRQLIERPLVADG